MCWRWVSGQSGEARIFLIQDDNLTAEVPLRRSILQFTLQQKYRSTGKHNPQRDGGPEKGLYRLHPIALLRHPWPLAIRRGAIRRLASAAKLAKPNQPNITKTHTLSDAAILLAHSEIDIKSNEIP